MNPSFHPGTLVIPDDYVNFWSIISIRYDFESSFGKKKKKIRITIIS